MIEDFYKKYFLSQPDFIKFFLLIFLFWLIAPLHVIVSLRKTEDKLIFLIVVVIYFYFGVLIGILFFGQQTPTSRELYKYSSKLENQSNKLESISTDYEESFSSCPINCTEAASMDMFNISKTDPCYKPKLDRDNDGYGCDRD